MSTERGSKGGIIQLVGAGGAALLLCAAAALGTHATFGLLSDSVAGNGSFAAGAVTLGADINSSCSVPEMLPGDSSAPCTVKTSYGGNLPAYVGLDILIETQSGTGGTPLYNPSDSSHDLQLTISSTNPSVTYNVPTSPTTCPDGAVPGSMCYEIDNEIVSTTPFTSSSSPVSFTTSVSLPGDASSGYRGGAASVILTVHAAQATNNEASGCSAGSACSTVGWR
jgi:hypothetical protein